MVFASQLSAPEGPVALPDGTWLVVEGGGERGCVTHISADGQKKRVVKKTGRPNGLAVDSKGVIWVAESKTPSLIRLTMEGKAEVVATGCDGEAFMFPNDLCFGPDGALYLTDSGVFIDEFAPNHKIRPDYANVGYDGRVYRVDVESGKITKLDNGIKFTNGIAFGPDNRLYVNETLTGNINRYAPRDGEVGPAQSVLVMLSGRMHRWVGKARMAWHFLQTAGCMWPSSGKATLPSWAIPEQSWKVFEPLASYLRTWLLLYLAVRRFTLPNMNSANSRFSM